MATFMERQGNYMQFSFKFGFQFNAWEIEIRMPLEYRFRTWEDAHRTCREMAVKLIVFPDRLVVLMERDYLVLDDQESYKCRRLKDEVYDAIGTPISPDDVNELIDKDILDEVISSGQYMLTDTDYEELELSIGDIYQMLMKKYQPMETIPFGLGCQSLKAVNGFTFDSLYYQIDLT